jgi:dienelactone hydrolase
MHAAAVALLLAAAEPVPETPPGEAMIAEYFRKQVDRIGADCLKDVRTKEDWEKLRPELRRQLLDMLGLWPLPPRTNMKATVTGKVESDKFTIEKVHFQSVPGLYVTGNLYVPRPAPKKAPAVLYVCGHGTVVKDGVPYGSKVKYQIHPEWFAENGYVSLVIDTLQLGEIEGIHHGTYRFGMWWWQSIGYTPAGVECWNGMRAIDYLQSRPEVDPDRIGVTGRSGGGAYSWWLTATDDRVKCAVPVAGIVDLKSHVVDGSPGRYTMGTIAGHCDCMFMVNTYRWDFPAVVALCAPRPVLLGNSDVDDIFPVPGYRRLAAKARKVYDLYGAGNKFQLMETAGPHEDTPELRTGAFRWMNRWLKNDTEPVKDRTEGAFQPELLKVFARVPDDANNKTIHESFVKPGHVEMPSSPAVAREWWKGQREAWMGELRSRVFGGWPAAPPDLNVRPAGDVTFDGLRLRAFDFTSEEGIELRAWLLTAARVAKPAPVVLTALDEAGWREWCADLGPEFAGPLGLSHPPKRDDAKFRQNRRVLEANGWAFAAVAPRGIGPTRWADAGTPADIQIRRRFALVGQTLDGQRVWDVRRALAVLRGVPDLKESPLWLQGKGDMAAVALYAGLFEPDLARFDLWHLPASHKQGPALLNVLKILDVPQAVALALPRTVRLYVKDEASAKDWGWTADLQKAVGGDGLQVRVVGD